MMILHSDANCFYASVEMVENPDLRNQRIAVCGDPEQRHGIVLTANYPAKRMGVKTGMANWQAMQACPGLVKVKPHYDLYLKYSKLLQRIYKRYSDNVEPFGMDECWISLPYDEDDAVSVAEEIRQTVKDETGLTVSIGASFSKALAKLGSDMKKPDALTVLRKSDFKEKCWDLPVSDLLYVGPRTTKKLNNIAITTIGQLANALRYHCPEIWKERPHGSGFRQWHRLFGCCTGGLQSGPKVYRTRRNMHQGSGRQLFCLVGTG